MARAVITGVAASPGVGLGRALIVTPRTTDEPSRGTATRGDAPSDPEREAERLRAAFEATSTELSALAARVTPDTGPDIAAILEAQALIASDPALSEPAFAAVASGVTAEAAVLTATEGEARMLEDLDDPRFRARAADVRDVGQRIARRLGGRRSDDLWHADGAPAVIIAEDLAPSETVTLRPAQVAGLALAGGAFTGHAAIVARALGLPLVLGLGAAVLGIASDSMVVVDGSTGRVLVEPSADELPNDQS